MTPLVVGAVLLAAVTHASWNALAHHIEDQLLAFTLVGSGGAVCGLALVCAAPVPAAAAWPALLVSVLLHVLYQALLMRSFGLGDFGQIYPIARGTAPLVVTVLAAVFVHERPDGWQLAGVGVASAGLLGLALWGVRRRREGSSGDRPEDGPGGREAGRPEVADGGAVFGPPGATALSDAAGASSPPPAASHGPGAWSAEEAQAAAAPEPARATGRLNSPARGAVSPWPALLAAVATGLAIASYTVVDGVGVRASGTGAGAALGYVAWLMLLEGVPIPLFALWARRRTGLAAQLRPVAVRGLLGGVLSVAAYGLVLWAQTRAPLAPVAALRESSIIAGAAIGALFFRERFGGARVAASVLMVGGIALMLHGG